MEECERGKRTIFARKLAGRGISMGDFDKDGSVDVLVAQNEAPGPLRNNADRSHHWPGVKLIAWKANIDAMGPKVTCQAGD